VLDGQTSPCVCNAECRCIIDRIAAKRIEILACECEGVLYCVWMSNNGTFDKSEEGTVTQVTESPLH
jgi:hypothetical protein